MESRKLVIVVTYIFFVLLSSNNTIKNIVSRHLPTHQCPLEFKNLTSSLNSTCDDGTWNGFLRDKCCKDPFNVYLDALALHANQTGKIYLNLDEQTSCLKRMKDNVTDVFTCGIEKLTSGEKGCSGLSVQDVFKELKDDMESFDSGCRLLGYYSSGNWDQTCGNCVKSWNEIKGVEDGDGDADLCRFSVLTSLTSSRMDEHFWMNNIRKCLGEQVFYEDVNMDTAGKKKKESETYLIGLLSGILAIVIVCAYIMAKRCHKLDATSQEEGIKHDLPKKSRYLKVSVKEILYATNNLDQSNYIGEGTAGKVYRGILSNKQHVAIKHIIDDGFVETFLREVRNLALVRHPNLVTLLGYCDNGDECFLIYELCTNGNLSEWLFGSPFYTSFAGQLNRRVTYFRGVVNFGHVDPFLASGICLPETGKNGVLSWTQRLEIAVDCARGLWFLHTYSEGCIVHRDIKPTNILLGPNCEAKLSDFGLSKVIDIGETYASSEVRGTFGYVDPEYQGDRQVNAAGDVYSFGIVLLQLLSGRRVINMNASKPMPLERMARSLTKGGSLVGFVDPKLEGEYSAEAFELIFKLALSCTGHKQERPSMSQVVERLEEAHDISVIAKVSNLNKAKKTSHYSLT